MDKRFVQFAEAKNLNKLLDELRPLLTIDPLDFWNDYFDIDNCKKEGLDNWGRILNFSRVISIRTAIDGVFGFGNLSDYPIPEDGYPQNFNNGYFYNPKYEDHQLQYTMSDFEFRIALKFRYRCLTSNLSMKAINAIMNELLIGLNSSYKCFVQQTSPMELAYKFNFTLPPWLQSLFNNRSILPVPAGVTVLILERIPL